VNRAEIIAHLRTAHKESYVAPARWLVSSIASEHDAYCDFDTFEIGRRHPWFQVLSPLAAARARRREAAPGPALAPRRVRVRSARMELAFRYRPEDAEPADPPRIRLAPGQGSRVVVRMRPDPPGAGPEGHDGQRSP